MLRSILCVCGGGGGLFYFHDVYGSNMGYLLY